MNFLDRAVVLREKRSFAAVVVTMFSFQFYGFLLVSVVFLNGNSAAEPFLRTCEPIRVELCRGLGYNMTRMPNLGGNDVQQEADYNLKSYSPLIQYGCSQHLKLFLCSVYVPMCTEKVANPIGPCRGLCENVRRRCYPVLQGFGFPWPEALNCSRFPVENNQDHMCMEGPKEKVDISAPVDPAVRKYECSPHSIRNGVPGCAPTNCDNNRMFDEGEKRTAEVWITAWAFACMAASLGSVVTSALGGGRVRAPPLLGLSLCSFLVGVGWALRSFAGPTGTSCWMPDPSDLKSVDGLPNAICASVFLLLYYFGMAANAWWVCLCAWWLASARLSWTPERMGSLTTALHVTAWSFPAIQTVAALVRSDVDSDELTGTCFIGNKNLQTLRNLVLIPYLIYFCVGVFILALGWVPGLRRTKLAPVLNPAAAPLTQGPPRKEKNFLGYISALYGLMIFLVMVSYFVEYINREKWLAGDEKPSLWFFLLLRHLMSFLMGISTLLWICCRKSAQVWKTTLRRLGPRSQLSKNNPVLKYPPTHHSGLIVPGTIYTSSRQSSRAHAHRKTPRSHHMRSGSETII
ncbi:frizzled-2-like [Anthonomus grandis grandis]|uniref:frizzled-2-like n=1 Tax=Anthonomus grandis grandis TaxID=2921223 RepID=UPI002166A4B0|nr:frizzled-2-like [Anthonomus grandis grandis]XP_050297669.1 frizzled-2-like [Anthonomus grandis grandis]